MIIYDLHVLMPHKTHNQTNSMHWMVCSTNSLKMNPYTVQCVQRFNNWNL